MQDQQKPKIDRAGWMGILGLFLALFIYLHWSGKNNARLAEERRAAQAEEQAAREAAGLPPLNPDGSEPTTEEGANGTTTAVTPPPVEANPAINGADGATTPAAPVAEEKTVLLKSGNVEFLLSTNGGGVKEARILEHPLRLGSETPVTLNDYAAAPIGSLSGSHSLPLVDQFVIKSQTEDSVVMETRRANGVIVTKTFRLPPSDPDGNEKATNGLLELDLHFINGSTTPINLGDSYLYFGGARQIDYVKFVVPPSVIWNDDGDTDSVKEKYFKKHTEKLESLEEPVWAGTMNRFFLTMISPNSGPEVPKQAQVWARRFEAEVPYLPTRKDIVTGVEVPDTVPGYVTHGGLHLPQVTVASGQQLSAPLSYQIYAGPKEYSQLRASGGDRQKAMFYGIGIFSVFDWMSVILQKVLDFFHNLVGGIGIAKSIGSWGVAIILMTILMRLLMWPLHAKSTRSMKRMAKLSDPEGEPGKHLAAIKEKYPDDPQKVQMETMAMYRRYGINPLGGCLPMFLQFPIFIGYFGMLRSAAELREEKFLWVKDLSQPDSVFDIGGFPINVLPLLMGITMFLQFAVGPKTGDKNQRMIFMFMPVIFLVMCYGYAAALALYWTTSNIFTIFQTWIMKFQPDVELVDKEVKAREMAAAEKKGKKKAGPRTGGGGGSKKKRKKK